MSGVTEKAKGKIKQAAGDATNNAQLKGEGVLDELKGKAKGAVHAIKDAFKSATSK